MARSTGSIRNDLKCLDRIEIGWHECFVVKKIEYWSCLLVVDTIHSLEARCHRMSSEVEMSMKDHTRCMQMIWVLVWQMKWSAMLEMKWSMMLEMNDGMKLTAELGRFVLCLELWCACTWRFSTNSDFSNKFVNRLLYWIQCEWKALKIETRNWHDENALSRGGCWLMLIMLRLVLLLIDMKYDADVCTKSVRTRCTMRCTDSQNGHVLFEWRRFRSGCSVLEVNFVWWNSTVIDDSAAVNALKVWDADCLWRLWQNVY